MQHQLGLLLGSTMNLLVNQLISIGALATKYWPKKVVKYSSERLKGRKTFDYSNNNGRYIIGKNELKFETAWSKASDDSIHVYNDPYFYQGCCPC